MIPIKTWSIRNLLQTAKNNPKSNPNHERYLSLMMKEKNATMEVKKL